MFIDIRVYYNHNMLVWCICCILIGVGLDANTFLAGAMERFNTFFTEALERFNTSTYEYTYTLDDKPCKIFIKIKKGTKIWSIYDQDNVDITHDILPYVGP